MHRLVEAEMLVSEKAEIVQIRCANSLVVL